MRRPEASQIERAISAFALPLARTKHLSTVLSLGRNLPAERSGDSFHRTTPRSSSCHEIPHDLRDFSQPAQRAAYRLIRDVRADVCAGARGGRSQGDRSVIRAVRRPRRFSEGGDWRRANCRKPIWAWRDCRKIQHQNRGVVRLSKRSQQHCKRRRKR